MTHFPMRVVVRILIMRGLLFLFFVEHSEHFGSAAVRQIPDFVVLELCSILPTINKRCVCKRDRDRQAFICVLYIKQHPPASDNIYLFFDPFFSISLSKN
jgi:hypothetical protein